jgi:hypothetical protein
VVELAKDKKNGLCLLDLMELFHQNRVPAPIYVPMPISEIRSKPALPPQVGLPAVADKK